VARLTKFFYEHPTKIAWNTEARSMGAYRTASGAISIFAQYRLADGRQKKRMLGRLGEASPQEFKAQAVELAMAARNGKDIVAEAKAAAKARLTLGDVWVAYIASLQKKGCSPNTIRLNTRNYTRHLSQWQGRGLACITRADCRALHAELVKRGPTLGNQCLKLLRTVFSYAQKRLDVEMLGNPVVGVEWAKERGKRLSIPSGELAKFWATTGQIQNPIRRSFWRFLLYCGARREEVASIRLADISVNNIKLSQAKGNRFYTIPITPQLADILAEARSAGQRLYPKTQYLFPASSASGRLRQAYEQRLMPGVAPHQMRRTYVSCAIAAGVNGYLVKSLVGHTQDKADMTSLYLVISEEERMKAARRVANYIAAHVTSPTAIASGEAKALTDQGLEDVEAIEA
jgi:integrase